MSRVSEWLWDSRTKVIGYLGAGLAQLGTSGLITNAKAVAWVAFSASMCTLAIGHFNDYKARRADQETMK